MMTWTPTIPKQWEFSKIWPWVDWSNVILKLHKVPKEVWIWEVFLQISCPCGKQEFKDEIPVLHNLELSGRPELVKRHSKVKLSRYQCYLLWKHLTAARLIANSGLDFLVDWLPLYKANYRYIHMYDVLLLEKIP